MKSPIIIGVDTGNRQIKTSSHVFMSGVRVSEQPQGVFQDSDTIYYNNLYYTLTSTRNSYKRDKTVDDDYFALTMFGVVCELQERGVSLVDTGEPIPVVLVVGLPPAHFAKQKVAFQNYFSRGTVVFDWNETPVRIEIVNVHVMVQGYAAIFDRYSSIRQYEDAYIVDIGGYTTDVIEVQNGRTNPSVCFSEDAGMIHLYNAIRDELNAKYDSVPKEQQIERLLYDPDYGDEDLEPGMKVVTVECARTYINDLLLRLREKGVDLRICKGIFVGGGSVRLRPLIEKSALVRNPLFVDDIKANAIGYETIVRYKYQQREGA